MVNHKKTNLNATHQWGSKVYIKIKQGDKLSSRAKRAHWIRFSSQSDSHCIYWPESHKVTVERNILFNKEKLHRYSPILLTNEEIQRSIDKADKAWVQYQDTHYDYGPYTPPDDVSEEREVERMIEVSPDVQLENLQPSHKHQGSIAQEPPRRNKRIYAEFHPPAPAGHITRSMAKQGAITGISSFVYLEEDSNEEVTGTDPHKFHQTSKCNNVDIINKLEDTQEYFQMTAYNSLTEPKNMNEAINNPIWKKSMDKELKAQINKNTWEMVIPPEGVNIVESKWTYCLKKNDKNTIICPKSHLVAQGFTQTFGVNYDETYTPVIRMTSLWTICTIAACNNWPIHQMDVNVAYLNATLENLIYMQKLPGYYEDKTEHVLLLKNVFMVSNNQARNGTNVFLRHYSTWDSRRALQMQPTQ